MTSKKQIAELLDTLVARHHDLVRYGPFVVLRPLRHIIRSVSIDRTRGSDLPDLFFSIGYTCDPCATVQGFWLEGFSTGQDQPRYWSQPNFKDAFLRVVEERILPMLRSIESFDALLSFDQNREFGYRETVNSPLHKVQLASAMGRFDDALETARWMALHPRKSRYWSEGSYALIVDHLAPLLEARDEAGIAAMLHDWEMKTIQKIGVLPIFEQAPFPFELGRSR